MAVKDSNIIRFTNCFIIRDHKIIRDDLWIRNGKIVNPEPIYFAEKAMADICIDCKNMLISPGYIDLQINGWFKQNFSQFYIKSFYIYLSFKSIVLIFRWFWL
jgi:N-acetylglucosamine-6-phosphate deacetylase